jgi:hypothetical protein
MESAHFEDLRVVKITPRHLWEMGCMGGIITEMIQDCIHQQVWN